MQAKELSRNAPFNQSFLVSHQVDDHFNNTWHFHEELELVYIERGVGTKFIGDSITPFRPGTLVLLGEYLPHSWLNDEAYFADRGLVAESYSVFFSRDCFGAPFFRIPELKEVADLLDFARRGCEITGAGRARAVESTVALAECPDYRRPALLLELLTVIARDARLTPLAGPAFVHRYRAGSHSRIDAVYDYVFSHFKRRISLNEAAAVLNMNPAAFSRYFKRQTNKTFVRFVNEVRVSYACKVLAESDLSISEVAYAAGFHNLSHFNKQFRRFKDMTPGDYYRRFERGLH